MLRAALRDEQLHFRALLLGQPGFKERCLCQLHRQKDFARNECRTMIILLKERREKCLV